MKFRGALCCLLLICLLSNHRAMAQVKLENVQLKPKLKLELKLLSPDGTNGSAIAWSSQHRKYYAVMAGNEDYPLEVFDEKGINLQSIPAGRDLRGLWYNPAYGFLEGNTFDYHDIVSYAMEEDGLLSSEDPYEEMYGLPVYDPQAVLTLNILSNKYAWFDDESTSIRLIDAETAEEDGEIPLPISDSQKENFNKTLVYTGIEGAEYGLLNYNERSVYLYNESTGELANKIELPKNAPICKIFRFSFANGHCWLFDTEKRGWLGYKVY